MKRLAFLLALALLAPAALVARGAASAPAQAPKPSLERILDALRTVETGGEPNGGRDARGDGGLALGPFQIHRAYFEDARVPGSHADCRDPEFARRVVVAYWTRWCPEALESRDARVLARVHNGGPRGAQKPATLAFARKVEAELRAAH